MREIAVHHVKIGAANPARMNVDEQLPRGGYRIGQFALGEQRRASVENHRTHRFLPPSLRASTASASAPAIGSLKTGIDDRARPQRRAAKPVGRGLADRYSS
jgi:hypothetical protein